MLTWFVAGKANGQHLQTQTNSLCGNVSLVLNIPVFTFVMIIWEYKIKVKNNTEAFRCKSIKSKMSSCTNRKVQQTKTRVNVHSYMCLCLFTFAFVLIHYLLSLLVVNIVIHVVQLLARNINPGVALLLSRVFVLMLWKCSSSRHFKPKTDFLPGQ